MDESIQEYASRDILVTTTKRYINIFLKYYNFIKNYNLKNLNFKFEYIQLTIHMHL